MSDEEDEDEAIDDTTLTWGRESHQLSYFHYSNALSDQKDLSSVIPSNEDHINEIADSAFDYVSDSDSESSESSDYPFSSTFATLVLFDFHTGFIFDETSAVIFADCPLYMFNEEGLSLTVGVLTFTLHWTVVLSALTDIIASPGLQPVTVPFSSTTATLVLLLL